MSAVQAAARFAARETFRRVFSRTVEYNIGTTVENLAGLQICRTLLGNAAYWARGGHVAEDVRTQVEVLDRDGILMMPAFLSAKAFREVLQEFESTRHIHQEGYGPIRGFGMFWKADFDVLGDASANFPAIEHHLRKNRLLNDIVAGAARRDPAVPTVRLITVTRMEGPGVHNDNQQTLHADLHLPTFKAFFYLNDVGEGDGPFVYARGSHRVSVTRLRYEYDDSVARKRIGCDEFPEEVIERHSKILGLNPQPIYGTANTLIVANNMGFHARGPFAPGHERRTVELGYRDAYLSRSTRKLLDAALRRAQNAAGKLRRNKAELAS